MTIVQPGEAVFRDRGSRFIGLAFGIDDEPQFRDVLEKTKKDFPAARHYCYAWRLGTAGERSRSSDDGEPSGTAGRPILTQLQATSVTNAAVIVVRYFGGTLLGTGGLINAYKNAAAMAIDAAATTTRFVMSRFTAQFDDADYSAVMKLLREMNAEIHTTGYSDMHLLDFSVRKSHEDDLRKKFAHLYKVTIDHSHAT